MTKAENKFCNGNPYTDVGCDNPQCKHKDKIKTNDYIARNVYTYKCSKCGQTTDFPTKGLRDVIKKLEKFI